MFPIDYLLILIYIHIKSIYYIVGLPGFQFVLYTRVYRLSEYVGNLLPDFELNTKK